MTRLHAHLLPALVDPAALRGATVVVIDCLRATTTMIHALDAGARDLRPTLEVDEARRLAAELPPGESVLGGERGGLRIDGFQLGNSPTEYRPEVVAGRTVVFTTTNGTHALLHARQGRRVLIGALVNRAAVARACVEPAGQPIHLLCAGTRGEVTREDTLTAGAIIARLLEGRGEGAWDLNDEARLALAAWRDADAARPERLAVVLRETCGGRNLLAEGFPDDLTTAAQLDRFDRVPEYDPITGRVA